jgi:dihydroorotate dehydrogenase (NAD+) catalytic subunit
VAPAVEGAWDFRGIPVRSPPGVPAGPLLNSRWIPHYAAPGFDVLTYKTVRSAYRACFEPPNLLPVAARPLTGEGAEVVEDPKPREVASWAISFGMPSKDPAAWRADVERARRGLAPGQALVVSVVASPEAGWTLDEIAQDFARCARWAAEAGAHAVEANLSCPNVCTQEANLYASAGISRAVAAAVRDAVGRLPVALKIGLFRDREQAEATLAAVDGIADALSTTNSITAPVRGASGEMLFGGARRGIGGRCITSRRLEELAMLREILAARGSKMRLIGVGGVATARDVKERMAAGAHHVQIATAAMLDPLVGVRIRKELAGSLEDDHVV